MLLIILFNFNIFSQNFHCGDTIVDVRDGQKYATVLIGTQCWMKQNLNIGTKISRTTNMTDNEIIEKYCYGDDSLTASCDIYGGLYQWDEAMNYSSDVHDICPAGWHVPSIAEFDTLILHYGGDSLAGGALKETGYIHWSSPNYGATNLSGFTALPGGYRDGNNSWFYQQTYNALFWNSSASFINLYQYSTWAFLYSCLPTFGLSIRCVCDSSFVSFIKEIENGKDANNIFSEVYPNPVTETSTILINNHSKGDHIIEIYNSTGQLIKKEIIYNNEIKIKNSEFPAGLYLYRIFDNNGKWKIGRFEIN